MITLAGLTNEETRTFLELLAEIPNYRKGNAIKYKLDEILLVGIFAILCGANTYNGIEAIGVYDAETHEKLTGESVKEAEKVEKIDGPTVEIVTKNGGTVNVRVGNGTEYEIIKEVSTGEVLEYIATAENGWKAVKVGTQVGWVSGEYSKKTEV